MTVLAPTIGSAGLADMPTGGAAVAAGSYSAALLALNGKAAASSCVPATFAATSSCDGAGAGSAGPLTVARLVRTASVGFFGV